MVAKYVVDWSDFSNRMDVPWNDKNGGAMKLKHKGHDYRIKRPMAFDLMYGDLGLAIVKLDHVVAGLPDHHLDLTVLFRPSTGRWLGVSGIDVGKKGYGVTVDDLTPEELAKLTQQLPPSKDLMTIAVAVGAPVAAKLIERLFDSLVNAFASYQAGKKLLPEVADRALAALAGSFVQTDLLVPLVLVRE